MHWTQTPEGKEKMAAAQRKAWAARRQAEAIDKPKKRMSAKARKNISEGMKRRNRRLAQQAYQAMTADLIDKPSSSNGHKLTSTRQQSYASQEIPTDTFAYALGHIESWIDTYAKSAGISAESLTARLGEVLRVKTSR